MYLDGLDAVSYTHLLFSGREKGSREQDGENCNLCQSAGFRLHPL